MGGRLARPLVIVCAGGRAVELASYIRDGQIIDDQIEIRAFVDDHRFEKTFEHAPVLGGIKELGAFVETHPDEEFLYVVAVTDNRTRFQMVERIEALSTSNLTPCSVMHSGALIGQNVDIGAGCSIGPGAILTARIDVGPHSLVDANSSVSHNAELGSFVSVGAGATICGDTVLGDGCSVGAGATVLSGVQIGRWSIVGAGSVVTDDVPANVTVAGSPARIIQRHNRGSRLATVVG